MRRLPGAFNDNPFSENQFKTFKYRPDFPRRFDSIEAARAHCRDFFPWYIRGPLADAQGRDCFYCAGRLTTRCAVDHYLPWSRHPDNTIDNLVAAHPACNNAKSASLAGLEHLRHWLARFQPGDPACTALAQAASGWPRRSDRVLSTARATYLWLPDGTRLWQHGTSYEQLDTATVRTLFASIA